MPGDYYRVEQYSRFPLRRHATSCTSFSFSEDDRASLVVAPSVVSVRVYSGEIAVYLGSGFVLDCNQEFEASILTAGTLFRGDDNLKVVVFLPNAKIFVGELEVCDFHFNLAIVRIRADEFLPPAKLGHINDFACIGSPRDRAAAFLPGSRVTALGRYQGDIKGLMVAYGEFR
ncbi:hypothetical protein OROGR_000712 [Orobanche gracilis]